MHAYSFIYLFIFCQYQNIVWEKISRRRGPYFLFVCFYQQGTELYISMIQGLGFYPSPYRRMSTIANI